jgi:hypothetical protein
MLDEALELRLEIFTGSDEHGPAVVPFVRGELERIDLPADARTDDNLGMFASHLFAALCRSLRDEALTEFSADDVIDAALAERPDALPASQAMAERALAALGAQLPHTEVRILALHFATLLAQHPKENR